MGEDATGTGAGPLRRIVVGMDGSANAAVALRWAVDEAAVHGAEVEAVVAWSYLDQHHPDGADRFEPEYTEADAEAALTAWVREAVGADAPVATRAVCDLPARALLETGDGADLVVVGARGKGGFEALLLGSVSERVAQLATRPVAVIRHEAPVDGGRVVVGVDGSTRSTQALRWAAGEARARNARLDVVHAWRPLVTPSPVFAVVADMDALEEAGKAILEAAVADPALAGLDVATHRSADAPARALIEQATGAGLVVVGTRGLGRITGTLLGSVSRQLLHHAPCPLVVL